MTRPKPTTQVFPWQKRVLTLSGVAILACVTTLLVYPMILDYRTLDKIAHGDPASRTELLQMLASRAKHSPATARRMERKLTSDDDAIFESAAMVLSRASLFDPASHTKTVLARFKLIEYTRAEHPYVRYHILHEACLLSAEDNPPLKALASLAARDEHPDLRELAAVLAAKTGDIESLQLLAEDDAPLVAKAARRCAAIAGTTLPSSTQTPPMRRKASWWEVDGAPQMGRPALVIEYESYLSNLTQEPLGRRQTRRLTYWIADYLDTQQAPPAMLMLVGAEHDLPGTADLARMVLAQAVEEDSKVTASQLRAAIATIERLDAPARDELCALIRKRWDPALEQEMTDAARVLGQQADLDQPSEATREESIRLLRQAVMWEYIPPRDDGEPMVVLRTPLASASAALALWRLDSKIAEDYLRHAAANGKTLPGDYIAWHVAAEDPTGAMELGARMLPRLGAGPADRVYNDNERAAGAMMLALAARTDEEKAFAIERITDRLEGDGAGGEDNPYVRGAYHGALLILGEEHYRETVQTLLTLESFPQRRALTALLVTNDDSALEWLIWNAQVSDETVLQLLAGRRLDDILTAVTDLPVVDLAAPNVVRLEAIARLRATYAIGQPADIWTPRYAPEAPAADTDE